MMTELEREKQLLKAGSIHDKITAEAKIRAIDEQLSRLLDLFVDGAISADEYKEKKASLINKKIVLGNNTQAIFCPVDKKHTI